MFGASSVKQGGASAPAAAGGATGGGLGADLADALSDPLGDDGSGFGAASPRSAAATATSGAGKPLPHRSAIQAAFGAYDISGVQAHTGAAAAAGTTALGARGLAFNGKVALGPAATLHTEAHEAAHAVQQASGVALDTGAGGGAMEAHADAVADRVVRGESAVDLLSQVAEPGPVRGGSSAVQLDLMSSAELNTYGTAGFKLIGKTSFGHVVNRLAKYHAADKPADKRTHALKLVEHIDAWLNSGSRDTTDAAKKSADDKKREGLVKLKLQAQTEAEFIRMKADTVATEAEPALHPIKVGDAMVTPTMVPSTAPLFPEGEPSVKSIKQGLLGDCWLLAGLAALVNKDPAFVKGMMTDNGTSVTVRLYGDKGPEYFKVSKDVPKVNVPTGVGDETRSADAFGQGALWVQVLEKAVGLMRGKTYKRAEGGQGAIAFMVLTGGGGTQIANTSDKRKLPWPGGGQDASEDVRCKRFAQSAVGANKVEAWWTFATRYKGALMRAQTLEAVQKVATDHPGEIDEAIVQAIGAYLKREGLLPGRMGSGAYSSGQLATWEFIQQGVAAGAMVVAGTDAKIGVAGARGASGEGKVAGMASGHQYTVLNTKVETGRNWIQVRNPWGYYSREYDEAADGTLTPKAKAADGDTGVSWLELSDFCAMFNDDVHKR
jgi:hypothetical protein